MNKYRTSPQTRQIERALSYPYALPEHSYALRGSEIHRLPVDFWPAGRLPVIACGSNAAPKQLIRKFSDMETDPIYVTRAKLAKFVCCYSAHITSYGSIPATLAPHPESISDCHITWLTEAQLDHMHKTEAIGVNYRFSNLDKVELICEERGMITDAYAYISLHGNLLLDGDPIVVSNIKAITPKPIPHFDQSAIQKRIGETIAPNSSLEEFILSNIEKSDLRRDRIKILRQTARKFAYPYEKVILS